MKVRLAKTAGFCMGVRRAMEMALAEANRREGPLFTYGPLIHNRQVLELLEKKEVKAIKDISEFKNGTLLIRAHGIPPKERKILRSSDLKIIDATCPRVAKVQAIIQYNTKKGYTPVIVGDKDHAEVKGLMGYGQGKAIVITNQSEIDTIPENAKVFLVAQTTQHKETYEKIVNSLIEKFPDALIFDTICEATSQRQKEIRTIANQTDGVVVVGGYHSGNTRRLVQVSESTGKPTFHVETEMDLDKEKLSSMELIGVTAGASTPNWMIKNVVKEIESIRSQRESVIGLWIQKLFNFLLLSNFMVALGAFSLTHAAAVLSNRESDLIHPLLTFLYVYAMRVLNRLLDKGASTYNDPERASFYSKHKSFLIMTAVLSIIGALLISYSLGFVVLLSITGLSLLGIIYSIPIVPIKISDLGRYSKIKDIPSSKNIMEALAWAAVISLIPQMESLKTGWIPTIITFYVVLSIAYVRSAFFDILQVQGDLIVGKETLPIILGEERTIFLLKSIIISSGLILLVMAIIGMVSAFAFPLALCFLSIFLCLLSYDNSNINPGRYVEYLFEGNLFLSGLLGLIWQILS